jgi:hypothetical protein
MAKKAINPKAQNTRAAIITGISNAMSSREEVSFDELREIVPECGEMDDKEMESVCMHAGFDCK